MSAIARFWSKVNKNAENGCWVFTGAKHDWGYGIFYVDEKRRLVRAHRFSYWLHFGPYPKDKFVLHKCDNPPCVNPDHLFLGTQLDNVRDCLSKSRFRSAPHDGMNNPNRKLNELEVKAVKFFYSMGSVYQRELGEIFGVTQNAISKIIRGDNWSSLK